MQVKWLCWLVLVLVAGPVVGAESPVAGAITGLAEPCSSVRDSVPASAPLADTVLIRDILILGDKRTRKRVIFREMGLKRGARVPSADLQLRVDQSYNTVMNTGLFVSADIVIDTLGPEEVALILTVKETWYLYPVPVFELADRNFNVWWNDQNASLDRVNVGGKLTYYNFTGRRDRFKVGFTTGYTREYEAGYRLPYINKAGSLGLEVDYSFRQRREQNYLTVDNRQQFYLDEDAFVFRSSGGNVKLTYRKALYVSHRLEIGYRNSSIADTIAQVLNPDFFGNGRSSLQFGRIAYFYDNDRRDVRNYPWAGSFLKASLEKDGLGITGERDGLTAAASYVKFLPLNERYSINLGVAGKYSLIRTQQPFLENRAIGFGSNGIVGYQFYVVDGLDMLIWRAGIRRQLWRTKINLGKWAFIEAFRQVPIRLLAAVQFNQGFANSPFVGENNPLNNTLLTGFSAGLDAVFYYDAVGSVQYNRNHLGEDGVFLALQLSF